MMQLYRHYRFVLSLWGSSWHGNNLDYPTVKEVATLIWPLNKTK